MQIFGSYVVTSLVSLAWLDVKTHPPSIKLHVILTIVLNQVHRTLPFAMMHWPFVVSKACSLQEISFHIEHPRIGYPIWYYMLISTTRLELPFSDFSCVHPVTNISI